MRRRTPMLSVRRTLYRQMQHFFGKHLYGLISWEQLSHDPPKQVDRIPGQQRTIFSKHEEVITVRFNGCALSMTSPDQHPPLGKIVWFDWRGAMIEGPIDETTWLKVAEAIKALHLKGRDYGQGRSDQSAG